MPSPFFEKRGAIRKMVTTSCSRTPTSIPASGGAREAGKQEQEGVDGALRPAAPAAGAAGGGRPRGVRTPVALEAGRPDPRARGRDRREEGASQTLAGGAGEAPPARAIERGAREAYQSGMEGSGERAEVAAYEERKRARERASQPLASGAFAVSVARLATAPWSGTRRTGAGLWAQPVRGSIASTGSIMETSPAFSRLALLPCSILGDSAPSSEPTTTNTEGTELASTVNPKNRQSI